MHIYIYTYTILLPESPISVAPAETRVLRNWTKEMKVRGGAPGIHVGNVGS